MDQRDLIKLVGENLGDKLWHLADDAIDTVKTIIKRDKIDCFLRPGIANLGNSSSGASDLHSYAEFLEKRYKQGNVDVISKEESLELCISNAYKGGILPHTSEGSKSVKTNGVETARLGDPVVCGSKIVFGVSFTVMVGE